MRLAPLALVLLAFPSFAADRNAWDGGFEATAFHFDEADGLEARWSWSTPRAALRVGLPFLAADGAVVLGGAVGPSPVGNGRRNGSGTPQAATLGSDPSRESGVGDLRVYGRAYLTAGRGAGRLVGRAGVKLPTADEAKGLGTGKTDWWAGVGWIRSGWTTDVEAWADWVALGDTDEVVFDDGPAGGVALSWAVRSSRLTLGVEGASPVYEGDGSRVAAFAEIRWGRALGWSAEVQAGVTDAAPDLGILVGIRR